MALAGWIKVHRALADHHIASDPCVLSVWMHLLMMANHAPSKRLINGRVVTVLPGQALTSRKSLAAKTGVQESKVERILSMLKSEQQIEQHGTAKFRVISIVNWHEYQSGEQQNEQQMNSKRTADEQQMNTLEERSIPANADIALQECKESEEKNTCPQQAADDPGPAKKAKPERPIPFEWIKDRYNEICGHSFKGAAAITDERKKNITKCWGRKVEGRQVFQSGDFWREYFAWCLKTPNWHGEPGKTWKASLEFVTRHDIVDRVIDEMILEGVFASE